MEHKVVVKPSDVSFDAHHGESVMGAGPRAGIKWPTVCGGAGECAVCYIELTDDDGAQPLTNAEKTVFGRSIVRPRHGGVLRLACQFKVTRDLTVHRIGIRPTAAAPQSQDSNIQNSNGISASE